MAASPVCAYLDLHPFFHTFKPTAGRPLWVISGHCERTSAMSAFPPKADMLSVSINVR